MGLDMFIFRQKKSNKINFEFEFANVYLKLLK